MSVAPYPGLRPYDEEERDNFFGRETDSKILIDQILANRLTLLFAATGVGKSSLLRASVIPRLKEPLGENLDVVFFNDWVAPPLPNLKRVILTTLHEQGDLEQDVIAQEVVDAPLSGFLEFCCLFTSQPFLIVLDQFEEFFRYRGNYPKEHSQALIDQLTEVILNKAIPVAVVLSMREDYALELNDFKPRLPMILFENYYRLEKLTREAAMDAIQIPAQRVGFKYEGVLFELLLKDLLSRELDRSKGSMVADTIETVEPPYLQIICSQLWMRDQNDPEKTIRYTTYEKAGGAKGLLDNFIGQDVMSRFSFAEKQLASKAFDHLVSRRGTKMPHTVEDLSQMLGVNPDELRKVLDKLEQNRVLRRQQREKKVWYELYHDMFSHSIDDWNTAWKNRMRVRRSIIGGLSAAAVGAILLVGYDTWVNATSSHLRMSLSDPYSMVELWKGKQGSWDFFRQKRFLSQLNQQVKDREPDKRLPQWPVNNNDELAAEVIGTLPLKDRVTAFSQDGQHAKALKVAKDAISDTEVAQSKEIIANVAAIKIIDVSHFLWDSLLSLKHDSLRATIDGEFSTERVAYWVANKEGVLGRLKSGSVQHKALLAGKLGKLVLTSNEELLSVLIEQAEDKDASVRSKVVQALGELGSKKALPVLLEQLKSAGDDLYLFKSVVLALVRLGDKGAVHPLLEQLDNSANTEKRSIVVYALGALGDDAALPALLEQLKDESGRFDRTRVVLAAGQLNNDKLLPKMLNYLRNDSAFEDFSVLNVLVNLGYGEDVLPIVLDQLKKGDAGMRSNMVELLRQLNNEDVLPELIEQLKHDRSESVRSDIVDVVALLGGEKVLSVLIEKLKDDSVFVRLAAAGALAELGSKEALPALVELLKENNLDVRLRVVSELGSLDGEDVLPLLIAQLEGGGEKVHATVTNVLSQLKGENLLPALLSYLTHDNAKVRSAVAQALGGNEKAIPALIERLVDEVADVRSSAARALGQMDSEQMLPVLIAQLEDEDDAVRRDAALALASLGGEDALPELLEQLKNDDADIRLNIVHSLGQLESERALPVLLEQLKDDNESIRSAAVQILGQVGGNEELPALLEQLRQDDEYNRMDILGVLAQLGGKEVLPVLLSNLTEKCFNYSCESVIGALGQIRSKEALPVLFSHLRGYYSLYYNGESDYQLISTAAQSLGQLGGEEALPELLLQLENANPSIRSSVVDALGVLKNQQALPELVSLFGQEKNPEVLRSLALSLLRLGDERGGAYLLEYIDKSQYGGEFLYKVRKSESDTVKEFLLKGFNNGRSINVQTQWIRAFETCGATDALPLLYRLSNSDNIEIKQMAQSAIATLETDYKKLLAMIENSKLKLSLRFQALTALFERHQQQAVPDLIRLLKTNEKLYGRKIWRMLDELKAPEAKALLETRIDEIRQSYANWRDIRDSEPHVAEGETKEQNPDWKQWKEKLDASKPAYAVHYAHALARIDPQTGIKLLEHEIADIRKGAWYGLASLADLNLVKQLTALRLRSHDQPLFRHATYRAIDLSLAAIQYNNKPEDLQALEAWYPTLKQQEMQQEEVKTEDELSITPRVDWTIHLISYNLKAKAELQRRYQVFVAEQKKKTDGQAPQQIQ